MESSSRYEEETADRGIGALHHIRSRTRSRTNENVVGWLHNDPENPYNWPNVSSRHLITIPFIRPDF